MSDGTNPNEQVSQTGEIEPRTRHCVLHRREESGSRFLPEGGFDR